MRNKERRRRGGKDCMMSDMEAKILELIQSLTLEQQIDALNYALAMIATKKGMPPAPPQTSEKHTP